MPKKYKRGLLIGRFQPFHLGHIDAITYALERCDCLVICVGSSDKSGTSDNPIGLRARSAIIKAGLSSMNLDLARIRLTDAPDFESDDDWYDNIKMKIGHVDAVFSGNGWVNGIFEEKGVKVIEPPVLNRKILSGTRIRYLIKNKMPWKHLVPKGSVDLIITQRDKIM